MNAVRAFNNWNLAALEKLAKQAVDGDDSQIEQGVLNLGIEQGYVAVFNYLLDYCIGSPNWKRALYWATKNGYCDVVELVLSNCEMSLKILEDLLLHVCKPHKRRLTSIGNRVRIAELLCKCGANCDQAVWIAAGWGAIRLLQVLTPYWDSISADTPATDLSYSYWGSDADAHYVQPLQMPNSAYMGAKKHRKHPIINAAANNQYSAVVHFLKIDPTLSRYASPEHKIDALEAFCDYGDPQSFVDAIYDLQKTNDDLYEYCIERLARLTLFCKKKAPIISL